MAVASVFLFIRPAPSLSHSQDAAVSGAWFMPQVNRVEIVSKEAAQSRKQRRKERDQVQIRARKHARHYFPRGVFFQRESAGKFPISLLKSLKITSISYQCFSI